ncbi:hypothetical protein BsWGS_05784 [Bradybaena similaris]
MLQVNTFLLLIMSGKPSVPRARPGESINSSSESSFSSDINLRNTIPQTHLEKIQKLEDKLAGYRTVVKQFPKLQGTIAELQRKQEEQQKELAYHRANEAEQHKKILILEKLLQDKKQGLADLDTSSHREALSQSHSSPSFEIIGKSPCSTSEHFSQMQEVGTTSARPATIQAENHSPRSSYRHITVSPQQQTHEISSLSKDPPFQSLNSEKAAAANIVGPPKITEGFIRAQSANVSANEQNSHYSALSHWNSYPALHAGTALGQAFVSRNQKQFSQMDLEAVADRLKAKETTQQTGGIGATQVRQNLENSNSYQAPNITTSTAFNTFSQTGTIDTGARPKEWKPLNTLAPQTKAYSDVGLVQLSIYGVAHHIDQMPVKTQEHSRNELISFLDTNASKSDQTHNQQVLNMNNKMGENFQENPLWNNGCDDLMRFPSLNTNSPSPVSERNGLKSAASPVYNQQSSAVIVPAGEQLCLANQVESMAAILERSDSPIGMSDMLYKFAETAKNMESQLHDYKALIQQQQVQIQKFQSVPELSLAEENTKLREEISVLKSENETLLEFIGASKESKSSQVEPGWVTVPATQSMADPVRAHYPDSPMMKKIEALSIINTKLFIANKDWHNKWEALRQQTQEEKADLEARVKSLETINNNLQESVTSLEQELKIQRNSVQDLTKANDSLEEEKSTLQKINETLKTKLSSLKSEVKDLTRSKQVLESELASLKDQSRSGPRPGSRDHTETVLLKQQLTVFAEDFEKEKKDRILAEKKAEKWKQECDQIKASFDTKLKKINVQLRAQEDDLRTKARHNADLLYQVDDLKLKLQREQRKNALAAHNVYNCQPPPPSYQGPMSMAYSNGINSHITPSNMARPANHLFVNGSHASAGFSHQNSPEHLPGAWKCKHCTYINYPNRTVCDICGYTNSSAESLGMADSISGRSELQSRGEDMRWKNAEDIVVDALPEEVNLRKQLQLN